ncbi:MAG TPA: hypothetical protein VMQ83_10385 [Gammaproteobacteria bacterium]|nr:hypothetical protein [Gammaproteobacteria bacterium]
MIVVTLALGIGANTAIDAPMVAAVSAILILVSLLASYLSARQATRVDPLIALKTD